MILEKLKNKRREIAEREGKELFMIFHNSTLEETAKCRPKTLKDLKSIKGWGKKKIEKYGADILKIINNDQSLFAGSDEDSIPVIQNKKETSNLWRETVKEKIFEVGEFVELVNGIVSGMGQVKIKGELNEVEYRQGNVYFSLKDSSGQASLIRCLVWRWDAEYLSHLLENGLEVIVKGVPGIYLKRGTFSFTVKNIEPVGIGALKKALEALKKKLENKGYFDEARKQPIPDFIKNIGLVTSENGEAINDFRRNVGNFGFQINLFDVYVEGDYAEASIIKALKWLNLNRPDLDVIALVRGGGSFESLQTFNSERLVETIIASRIPIITGIGHEGDETIADFVSDKRCSTPTAVAELIKSGRENLILKTSGLCDNLILGMVEATEKKKRKTKQLSELLSGALTNVFTRFRKLEFSLAKSLYFTEHRTQKIRHQLEILGQTSIRLFEKKLEAFKTLIGHLEASLLPLSPEGVLARGYGIVYNNKGILKKAGDVEIGEHIQIKLSEGSIKSVVEEVNK